MSTISKHTPAISLQTNRNPNQADNKPGIQPIKQSENKTYNAQRVFNRTVLFRIFHTRTYARERTLNCNACFWDQVAEEIGIRSLRPNQITRRDVSWHARAPFSSIIQSIARPGARAYTPHEYLYETSGTGQQKDKDCTEGCQGAKNENECFWLIMRFRHSVHTTRTFFFFFRLHKREREEDT